MKDRLLCSQLQALGETDPWYVPLLANAAALLMEGLPRLNWAGFYLVRGERLVLGPFQGKVACIHIARGKGVCGTAWEKNQTLRVNDVHAFPGHIACDGASRSELVIPLRREGKVAAVLDLDSPVPGRFSQEDQQALEQFAQTLESIVQWEETP